MAKKKDIKGKHSAHAAQQSERSFWQKNGADSAEEDAPVESVAAFESASKTSSWSKEFWKKKADDLVVPTFESYGADDAALADFKKKRERRKRLKKGFGIAAAVIGGLIVLAYAAGCVYFSDHFLPKSTLGSFDVSLMTKAAAVQKLDAASEDCTMTVEGAGLNFTLSTAETGLKIDSASVVADAMSSVPLWQWPYQVFRSHDLSSSIEATYNRSGLGETVKGKVDAFNTTALQPTDATIAYDATIGGFKVAKEKAGTALDVDAVVSVVEEAAFRMEKTVYITADQLKKPAITADSSKLATAATSANKFLGADLALMLSTTKVAEVNSEVVSQWVTLDADLNPSLSQDKMTAWVEKLAEDCDTVGSQRTYTRPDGAVITVSGGSYGWGIDHDALITAVTDGVNKAQVATIDIPCSQTAVTYNGVGKVDFGTRYVDIDLTQQHAVFYDGSNVLWETDVITGKPDGEHNTPQGVWMVNSKSSPQKLVGSMTSAGVPEYISTVQYWMPFVGNSIGMHDATWQPSFGGSMYANGYGSHGCVNLSYSAAQTLYGLISIGDVVIAHY